MFEKLQPLYDRVVVSRLEDVEEKSPAGIIIPDTAKEKGQLGRVISVGAGRRREDGVLTPLLVKAGDTVLFAKYAGTEIGKELLVLREDDLLGILPA